MTKLVEIREKIRGFYAKNDVFINPLLKFMMAFTVFNIIARDFGYVSKLSILPVVVMLALISAIIPVNGMVALCVIYTLVELYGLSLEVAVVALVVFLLIFTVYFRFAPKDGIYAILTPLCQVFGLGPVMPVAAGLIGKAYSAVSIVCGTIFYYFLHGIKENASTLANSTEDTAITSKFSAVVNQLVGNKEMYLVMLGFALVSLTVYLIRNLSVDHAWNIAIIVGAILNFIVLFGGYLVLGISGKTISLVIGTVVSIIIGHILQFLCFHLDYSRIERVQFEDDEYCYYVKAIPKVYVTGTEKQVKRFAGGERIDKRQLSKEMDISEELLK